MTDYSDKSIFQLSSASTLSTIAVVGTADNKTNLNAYVTDLKITCGGTGRTITFKTVDSKMSFDIPANGLLDFTWNVPYKFSIVSSTGVQRTLVASVSGAGLKYTVTGYIEKP
jgi:hypothetical protein